MPIFYQLIIPSEVTIRASVSQQLASTAIGVTITPPPSRTVSVGNGQLQTSGVATVDVTIPIVASSSQALSATAVASTRTPPPSRTVSVSNASLQRSAASSITADVPNVTISASASQGLSATGVGVLRTPPSDRTVKVSNAQLQTSAASSVSVQTNTGPNASLTASPTIGNDAQFDASGSTDPDGDTLEYRYDPGDGSGFTSWGQGTSYTHTYPSGGFYIATVEVREQNTPQQLTDSASVSVTI